jgi:hypothetical protein
MSVKRKTPKKPMPAVETVDADMSDAAEEKPKRLCSEIQLFDLCSKGSCNAKDGRFCTDEKLLARFEAISDEEDTVPDQYDGGEFDEDGEEEFSSYGDDEDGTGEDEEDYDEEP